MYHMFCFHGLIVIFLPGFSMKGNVVLMQYMMKYVFLSPEYTVESLYAWFIESGAFYLEFYLLLI